MSQNSLQALLSWATENGTFIHPHITFESNEQEGVCAIKSNADAIMLDGDHKDISKIEHYYHLKIPSKIIITPEISSEFFKEKFPSFNSEFISKINNFEFSNWNSLTKLYIAYYRFNDVSEKCFCQTYIDSLPPGEQTIFPDIPFLWSKNDQKLFYGTNLRGNYLKDKLIVIMKEWNEIVSLLVCCTNENSKTSFEESHVKTFDKYMKNTTELLKDCFIASLRIPEISNAGSRFSWLSFQAYLWAHIIMTSRSFPFRIINQNGEQSKFSGEEGMLVPVLDLLNHRPGEKVTWSSNKSNNISEFMFYTNGNFDGVSNGDEIFNNYGLKINEELLLGYGFIINDNEHDACSLRIANSSVLNILKKELIHYPMVKLPTLDTYSNKLSNNDDVYKDGLLYFISKNSDFNEDIIQVFSIFSKTYLDEFLLDQYIKDKNFKNTDPFYCTLKMRLEGIKFFLHALESKAEDFLDNSNYNENYAEKDKFGNSQPIVKPDVKNHEDIALSYMKLQNDIIQSQIKKGDKLIKQLLKASEKSGHVLTYQKIVNRDSDFREAIRIFFDLDEETYSLKNNNFFHDDFYLESIIIILWLIRCGNKNHYPAYKRLDESFDRVLPDYFFQIYLHFKINYVKFTDGDSLHPESLEAYKQMKKALDDRYDQLKEVGNETELAIVKNVFNIDQWRLIDFIIGGEIEDKLCFNRIGKKECFLILDEVMTF